MGHCLMGIHMQRKEYHHSKTLLGRQDSPRLPEQILVWDLGLSKRTARRSNQSILKEISPGCSLEGLMLKMKLQYFGHLM